MKIRFRFFHGPTDWDWVKAHVPILRVEDTCGIVAFDGDTGRLLGAGIFDNFLNDSAQLTLIMDTPMLIRHGFLDAIYEYLFVICKKNFCYALVNASNEKSIKLTEHVGYKHMMNIPNGYRNGVDFLVYQLSKNDFYRAKELREAA